MEKSLKTTENQLGSKLNELNEVTKELEMKRNIVEAITKLANGKH